MHNYGTFIGRGLTLNSLEFNNLIYKQLTYNIKSTTNLLGDYFLWAISGNLFISYSADVRDL